MGRVIIVTQTFVTGPTGVRFCPSWLVSFGQKPICGQLRSPTVKHIVTLGKRRTPRLRLQICPSDTPAQAVFVRKIDDWLSQLVDLRHGGVSFVRATNGQSQGCMAYPPWHNLSLLARS